MSDPSDKLAYFQAIIGLEDFDLCVEILTAHCWNLELAISSFSAVAEQFVPQPNQSGSSFTGVVAASPPGLVWRVVTLPISVISGSLGLISGAIGLRMWAAGGVMSYSLGMIGLGSGGRGGEASARLVSVLAVAMEAAEFVASFERKYGTSGLNFIGLAQA